MATVFTRWLYPIATKPSVTNFRAKLCDDSDVDGVELAGLSTPSATELDQLDNKQHFNSIHSDGAATTYTKTNHLLVERYPDSSKPIHPLAASHADAEDHVSDHVSDTSSTLLVGCTDSTDAIKSKSTAGRHPRQSSSVQPDLHQLWHKAASDVRLVISIMLELAANQHSADRLNQLLASSTWEEACQHCRDGLLLR